MTGPTATQLRQRSSANRSQVNGWLWRARHAIRKGNPRLACEAMLSALWLLGACRHKWAWLPETQWTLDPFPSGATAVNAYCTECGATTWAHGHGPTNPRPAEPQTPTTERS